eukprot:TRINITY_DN3288_c0_g1_i4.p1 TRINITY_DN3288_c0_g1~~TRINITY_DN3288_c0_g1_i4.p1  ORF type:complete len:453 (+),score=141.20 TRINITY_DN3288_c0_g1_i4:170-1528(+)
MQIVVLILVLLSYSCTAQQIAGFKTTATEKAINYFTDIAVNILEEQLKSVAIPSISGSIGSPIGNIDYSLTAITLTGFQVGSADVTLAAPNSVGVALGSVSASLSLNWQYQLSSWPNWPSDSGSGTVTSSGSTASLSLAVTEANGVPQVSVTSVSVSISNLNINLNGGASWLYDLFVNDFDGQIASAVNSALESAIETNANTGLNNVLRTIPTKEPITAGVEIDFPLVDAPAVTASYFTLDQLGEFYVSASKSECPAEVCPTTTLPDAPVSDVMGQFAISDFVLNSAGYAFFKQGVLDAYVEDADLPANSPVRLNTTSFKLIIPNLYKMYPNCLITIYLYSTQPPAAVFAPSGAKVLSVGNMEWIVNLPNGSKVQAFTLNGSITTAGAAFLNGLTLWGNLTYLTGTFEVYETYIGPFSPSTFDDLLNLFFAVVRRPSHRRGIVAVLTAYLMT